MKIDDLSFKTYHIAFLQIILIEHATHVLSAAPPHPHLTPYQIALGYRILKFASDYDSTLQISHQYTMSYKYQYL